MISYNQVGWMIRVMESCETIEQLENWYYFCKNRLYEIHPYEFILSKKYHFINESYRKHKIWVK